MVQTINELNDVRPSPEDQAASELLAVFILAINWFTGVFFPMCRCVHAALCPLRPSIPLGAHAQLQTGRMCHLAVFETTC